MSKIFITGVNGFVGRHLMLEYKDSEIIGLVREGTDKNLGTNIKTVQGDILDKERIEKIIKEEKPDLILHLAAFTSPSESLKNPVGTLDNNIKGQLNILEAVRKIELLDTKLLVVSSAEVYGDIDEANLPISEEESLNPMTPYAVSKITQDFLGYQYFKSYGIKSIRVRPFNHIGPGQSSMFVVSAFARQIALIEKGKQEKIIKVGDLISRRDFTDVRDIVRAYRILMEKGKIGDVYNIGSGKSYKISEILEILLSFSKQKIEIKEDESLMREVDIKESRCDSSKINKDTGWKPEIPIEKSLLDSLDYWRNIL